MKTNKRVDPIKLTTVVIPILITAVLFLGIGYWAGTKAPIATSQSSHLSSATAVASVSATSSASVDSTGWKTYTNSANRFSFKYPSGWTIDDQGSRITLNTLENQKTLDLIKSGQLNGEGFGYSVDINVYSSPTDFLKNRVSNGSNYSLTKFSDLLTALKNGYSAYGSVDQTNVGGSESFSFFDSGYFMTKEFVIDNNPKVVLISFMLDNESINPQQEAIISSFSVINK
jgi:hypothetical protein